MREGMRFSVGGLLLSAKGAGAASALTVWKSLKVSLWEICDPAEIWVARFLEARSGSAMSDGGDIQGQLIKIGLKDPFIRAITGMVAVATAAGFVLSVLGDGTRAAIAVGLSLMFGVVLVVLRVLMNNTGGVFVKWLCLASSTIIIGVFLALIVFAVPAITVCWPESYRETLGLRACAMPAPQAKAFAPAPYAGQGITLNPANKQYLVLVFYRADRQGDAEHIVGALLSAGYRADGRESSLNEVIAANRSPGATWSRRRNWRNPLSTT